MSTEEASVPSVRARDLGMETPKLEELASPSLLKEFAASATRLFGVTVSIATDGGALLAGSAPPALINARVKPGPPVEELHGKDRYVIGSIDLEGKSLGKILLGPLDVPGQRVKSIAEHLLVSLGLILHAGLRALYASTMHLASITESYKDLEAKNRDLEDANARLKELDHLKSAFLATVSHELRTPLTSIIGYSEMLAEGFGGTLTKDQLEFVQTIRTKGDQLLGLIMSLLDLTKLESGTLTMRPIVMPIETVLGDAMSTAMPKASKKGVKLRIERGAKSLVLKADPDRLRQVFVNLVDNAVKFTPEGGEVVLSARELEPKDDDDGAGLVLLAPFRRDVEVRVADSGVGIPSHERTRIFDPFYQIDQSSTREQGGAGLGLSIVKRIVEAHNGHVRVESNEPKGTVFVVTIPTSEKPRTPSGAFPR
jgi:two-component system sensor histidine kinase BarA